jgi:hypothetical protein
MAKNSLVDEIASAIPSNINGKPWWQKLTADQEELVKPILDAWRSGKFGAAKITAARAISHALVARGIKIGPQGVLTWLQRG